MRYFRLVRRYVNAVASHFVTMCASQASSTSEELQVFRDSYLCKENIDTGCSILFRVFLVNFSRRDVLRVAYEVIFNGVRNDRCIRIIFCFKAINGARTRPVRCVGSFVLCGTRQIAYSRFSKVDHANGVRFNYTIVLNFRDFFR